MSVRACDERLDPTSTNLSLTYRLEFPDQESEPYVDTAVQYIDVALEDLPTQPVPSRGESTGSFLRRRPLHQPTVGRRRWKTYVVP